LVPHRAYVCRTTVHSGLPAHHSPTFPGTDENGIESSPNGIDAAGDVNPGGATASTTTQGEGQGSGTKACAGAGEAEPKTDTCFSGAQGGTAQDKNAGSKTR